jgi:CyaY protein
MDSQEYHRHIDESLARLAKAIEAFDPDELDYSTGDGVVKIEFPAAPPFIVNRQAAAQQMWFAAGARAWHYDWDEARQAWIDDRDGHELFARIAELVSAKIGRSVTF